MHSSCVEVRGQPEKQPSPSPVFQTWSPFVCCYMHQAGCPESLQDSLSSSHVAVGARGVDTSYCRWLCVGSGDSNGPTCVCCSSLQPKALIFLTGIERLGDKGSEPAANTPHTKGTFVEGSPCSRVLRWPCYFLQCFSMLPLLIATKSCSASASGPSYCCSRCMFPPCLGRQP